MTSIFKKRYSVIVFLGLCDKKKKKKKVFYLLADFHSREGGQSETNPASIMVKKKGKA